jgi:ketosteroid isomerase-like protein
LSRPVVVSFAREQRHGQPTTRAGLHRALLLRSDRDLLATILHNDVTWTLPGDNRISGTAVGLAGVVERAILFATYSPSFTLEQILLSRDDVALAIRNEASRGDLHLDEHLATVCTVEDGKIRRVETYLFDVDGMNAFVSDPAAET